MTTAAKNSRHKTLLCATILIITCTFVINTCVVASSPDADQIDGEIINSNDNDDLSDAQQQQRDDLPVQTLTVEDHVYVLDDTNYDNFVQNEHRIALVEFFAPWCGHCKSLAPEYSKAAKVLRDENIALAKVDGTKYSELARLHDIQGYPTLFVYLNGTKLEYDGPRTAQGIIDHMRTVADPTYKPPEDAVLTLTEANFDEIIQSTQSLILVMFYAPWCGHCKQLKPEYERAARRLLQLPQPIKLAKVDATVEKNLATRFEVKGYPTLIIFRNGGTKQQLYKGGRQENGIVEYMKQMQQIPSTVVTSKEQLRKQLRNDVPTIVGLFDRQDEQSLQWYDLFIDLAYDQYDEHNHFVHIDNGSLVKELKQLPNQLLLYIPLWFRSKYESPLHKLPLGQKNSKTLQHLLHFIGNHSLPLVGYRNSATYPLYANKYPLVVVYYDVDFSFDHRKQTQIILEKVQKVAAKFTDPKARIYFAISREQDQEQELKDLQLDDSGEDVNVAYFKSNRQRYAMPPTDDFSSDTLQEFVHSVHNGKVPPVIKSAFAPQHNPIGNLWTVVGSTFDQLVLRSGRDTLIEFYAPWCGQCTALEPVYRDLAKLFEKDGDQIRIAKLDATANDYPEQFVVNGYPTIYYVKASDVLNPIQFDGADRSLESLIKFVQDHLTQSSKDEL